VLFSFVARASVQRFRSIFTPFASVVKELAFLVVDLLDDVTTKHHVLLVLTGTSSCFMVFAAAPIGPLDPYIGSRQLRSIR
jgi:hypothetical protein